MGTTYSRYYNLVKVREQGPEAKDWAITDRNIDAISGLLKAFEQHSHTGGAGLASPIVVPILTESTTGGVLSPGVTIGVRLSYVTSLGLETDATVEQDITLSPASLRPLTPILDGAGVTSFAGGLSGGLYVYVMTKVKGSGETDASDALPVTVPYDQTYQVPLDFDAINSYTDGTTQLNIYRSAGLDSSFQLIASITDTSQTVYTDTNISVDQTTQPPSVSTFDATKSITIDWSSLGFGPLVPPPAGVSTLNVYITQQPGVWASQHLLAALDVTGASPPLNIIYQGSETLGTGWPNDVTQIPDSPPPINLATQATGGFVLSTDGDFRQHQAKNMVLENRSGSPGTPLTGQVYYDTSINNIRAYINGVWTNWGTTSSSAYTHPVEEIGGHDATNIVWQPGNPSGPSVADLLGYSFSGGGNRLAQTRIVVTTLSPTNASTTSTTAIQIGNLASTVVLSTGYTTQYVIAVLTGSFGVSVFGAAYETGIVKVAIKDSGGVETASSVTVNGGWDGTSRFSNYTTMVSGYVQASFTISASWWVSSGITSIAASALAPVYLYIIYLS